ncbi:MAG: hypothetical protein K6D97_01010 [Clostridia bacterium]|nr:hypothetical protein [Clostridia bacterium]
MKKMFNQKGAISMVTLICVLLVMVVLVVLVVCAYIKGGTIESEEPTFIESGDAIEPDGEEVEPEDGEAPEFTYSFLNLENQSAVGKNVIYSPLSIKYLLNLLSDGANGNTKKEINRLIKNESLTKYKNIDKVLSLANAVYIKDEYKERVLKSYINNVKNNYDAEIKYDSFKSANNINDWVSKNTHNTINNFLSDQQVQAPNLSMILVNALAVDMKWKKEFDENNTLQGQFNNIDGNSIETAYMHKWRIKTDDIAYKKDDDVTVLAMDLEKNGGVTLEFDAIMPNEMELSEFLNEIDTKRVEEYLSNLTNASRTKAGVNIIVPRFDFNYSISFVEELKAMGIHDAFDRNADFLNITGDKSLYVGDAIHKANIEFSEKGVKAAAASAAIMKNKAAEFDENLPVDVVIDKPFMFVIRDKDTGEVWFTGAVYEPVLWSNVEAEYDR